MKITKVALLLLVLATTLATTPVIAHSAYCEGVCQAAEIVFLCPGTLSAAQCCRQARQACGVFTGTCFGDAELVC
jgi:hypothetical protein